MTKTCSQHHERSRSSTAIWTSAKALSYASRLSAAAHGDVIGYRAQKHADILDVDRVGAYSLHDYWDRVFARPDNRLILDPGEFYILASQERLHIPRDLAAEMVAIDPAMGEFRVHYAGFFDPGFGAAPTIAPARGPCSKCAATKCHSSSKTARLSGASSMRKWPSRRRFSMARARSRIIRARG